MHHHLHLLLFSPAVTYHAHFYFQSRIFRNVQTGFRKGSLTLQYNLATDEQPAAANIVRPGFIVSFRNRYYVVGQVSIPVKKNDVIKFTVAVTELQNPFIGGLLSNIGQQTIATINVNVATNVNCAALNNRAGGNVNYTLENFQSPGVVANIGSIAANGLLTINTNIVGTFDIRVVATDTLAGSLNGYGWGRYTVTT